jgi:hypothetical protein
MIKILVEKNTKLMKINKGDKCLFFGNYWDFETSPERFEELFKDLNFNVEIEEKTHIPDE